MGIDWAAVTGEDTTPLGWGRGGPSHLAGLGTEDGRGADRTHLEATEPDHAVHHLCHTEAMSEVVEGVVPVVVVHTELWGEKGESPAFSVLCS